MSIATEEKKLRTRIKHLNQAIPAGYVATLILRNTQDNDHVIYTSDPLETVMQTVSDTQEKHKTPTIPH